MDALLTQLPSSGHQTQPNFVSVQRVQLKTGFIKTWSSITSLSIHCMIHWKYCLIALIINICIAIYIIMCMWLSVSVCECVIACAWKEICLHYNSINNKTANQPWATNKNCVYYFKYGPRQENSLQIHIKCSGTLSVFKQICVCSKQIIADIWLSFSLYSSSYFMYPPIIAYM